MNDTLDSLTITAFGTDSIILNNQKRVHGLSLPLRYTADSTVLVFHYSKDVKIKKDTILSSARRIRPISFQWIAATR